MADIDNTAQPPVPPVPPGGAPPVPPSGDGGDKNVLPVNIEDEMRRSYLDYSMSVIIGRALPDIRDGLKPVHRRILYAMGEMGLNYNRPTKKCARIIGDVLGKFHPHGDSAVYDALVRMAQPFSMRYPLIDGQGNFGSVDGDPPAAYRYTEARLARIAQAMLEDIDKETVDFRPNFDDSTEEPEVLPARIPNLLVNGSSGIAVGMATNIPPHNITEIVNAAITMVQKPDTGLTEIMKIVPGPDFPTGGFLLGRQGIYDYFTKGRGTLKMRARVATEDISRDREALIVTELPYQVNKARLIADIAQLANEKRVEGISDVRDESDRDGMRIVIELKRGETPEVVLNNLYKHTQLQTNFGVIMLSIVNGQPRELGILDCIRRFIDHRIDVVRRRTDYLLRKAREREHLLLGFKKALDHLDVVIELIRSARTPKDARAGLTGDAATLDALLPAVQERLAQRIASGIIRLDRAIFDFSDRQAQAIIELQLQRLTGMEQQKIVDELAEIQRMIAEYLEILGDEKKLRSVIVKELREVEKDFGDARRTQIIEDTGEINIEDLVQQEDVAVTVTRGGYLKRTPIDVYQRQTRGGKGRIGMGTRTEDAVEHLIIANTHSYLLIFTTKGRVYWLKIYELPDAGPAVKGKNINGLINLQPDEAPRTFLNVKEFPEDRYATFVTRRGEIKKTALSQFANRNSRGIIAMDLDQGDELVEVKITTGKQELLIATHEGMAIRFNEAEVTPRKGRDTGGVRAISLEQGDYVIGFETFEPEQGLILSISENGFGKRTPLKDYRLTRRGAKGVINMKTTPRIGKVLQILAVKDDTELMIITHNGKMIRIESAHIRQAGRSTQGVKLVTLEEGDHVAAASCIPEESGNGKNGNGGPPVQ